MACSALRVRSASDVTFSTNGVQVASAGYQGQNQTVLQQMASSGQLESRFTSEDVAYLLNAEQANDGVLPPDLYDAVFGSSTDADSSLNLVPEKFVNRLFGNSESYDPFSDINGLLSRVDPTAPTRSYENGYSDSRRPHPIDNAIRNIDENLATPFFEVADPVINDLSEAFLGGSKLLGESLQYQADFNRAAHKVAQENLDSVGFTATYSQLLPFSNVELFPGGYMGLTNAVSVTGIFDENLEWSGFIDEDFGVSFHGKGVGSPYTPSLSIQVIVGVNALGDDWAASSTAASMSMATWVVSTSIPSDTIVDIIKSNNPFLPDYQPLEQRPYFVGLGRTMDVAPSVTITNGYAWEVYEAEPFKPSYWGLDNDVPWNQ